MKEKIKRFITEYHYEIIGYSITGFALVMGIVLVWLAYPYVKLLLQCISAAG
jgi:hypothetical protein